MTHTHAGTAAAESICSLVKGRRTTLYKHSTQKKALHECQPQLVIASEGNLEKTQTRLLAKEIKRQKNEKK